MYNDIINKKKKLAVIGLGYVGLPLSVAAANSGFKVVGHDILQPDGAMEALVLQSQNTKQGLRISARLHDTGLIAFKGSLDNQITRFNTPTLASLAFSFADITLPNNELSVACAQAEKIVSDFLNKKD